MNSHQLTPGKATPDCTQAAQARHHAQAMLQRAASVLEMHASRAAPMCKRQGAGAKALEMRFAWPGVVEVYDPETGRLLARSEPGKPCCLAADFDPLLRPTPHGWDDY